LDIHLVDGTYELFRHFFALPPHVNARGEEVAATRGVLGSIAGMLGSGVTHIGVATDHVIESFRNDIWPGYKTSAGVDPRLLAQFTPLEDALGAMGVVVWPMVELEADDALAAAATSLSMLSKVNRVYICSPDKDLAQCVRTNRVVQLDRRTGTLRDQAGVRDRFGVPPSSIPDYLALVGDSADGYPGLQGWGERSTATVLGFYGHLEAIPRDAADWEVRPRGAERLAATLRENFELALLFRGLATLRTKEPVIASPDELYWRGPNAAFTATCKRLEAPHLASLVAELAAALKPTSPVQSKTSHLRREQPRIAQNKPVTRKQTRKIRP
jgi:5'-3' exonuclease